MTPRTTAAATAVALTASLATFIAAAAVATVGAHPDSATERTTRAATPSDHRVSGSKLARPKPALLITPGKSLGKVRWGSTPQQVRKAAGKPTVLSTIQWLYAAPGHKKKAGSPGVYILLTGDNPGPNIANSLEVFRDKRYRTSRDIGVGSTFGAVKRAYPKADCSPRREGICRLDTRVKDTKYPCRETLFSFTNGADHSMTNLFIDQVGRDCVSGSGKSSR
jgi:hypothetical protein